MRSPALSVAVPLLAVLAAAGALAPACAPPKSAAALRASVTTLAAHRVSPHAYGRAGDLALHGDDGSSIIVKTQVAPHGHRPLRGSVVDVAFDDADRHDPLLWWRAGFRDASDKVHTLVATEVAPTSCSNGQGVRVRGVIDDVTITTTLCAEPHGRYMAHSDAVGLPKGAELIDEVNPGTSPAIIDGQGAAWEGDATSRFLALGEEGIGLLFDFGAVTVRRKLVHIATETFPAAVLVRYGGASADRVLHVVRGDALDALARSDAATRVSDVGLGEAGGSAAILNASGREIARAVIAPGRARVLKLPADFGASVLLRDADGVPLGPPRPFVTPSGTPAVGSAVVEKGTVDVVLVDEAHKPIGAHVLFRGLDGTPDPLPTVAAGSTRAFAAGPSIYVVDGAIRVPLAVGRYEILATHGITHSLVRKTFDVTTGGVALVHESIRRVVDTSAWTSGDFHLHAAPSPDAPVPLEARVASLHCEGVDVAVATDHNHITDYAPSAKRIGVDATLTTIIGDEITSSGANLWGHFNAYPIRVPTGVPEEGTPPYFDIGPAELFSRARALGAGILQVNHARMAPRIGYFDLTHLNASTGASDPTFSENFDALEAFNGIWLEQPDRIREGARDLVGLARRGMRPAAMGNSDSHRLLYEEAGYPRTFVHTPAMPFVGREARVVAAVGRRDTMVTSGPLIEMTVEGKDIGSVVALPSSKSVHVKLRVSAPAWVPVEAVEVWVDDEVAVRIPVPGPAKDGVRFERELTIPITRDSVVLAWADAETPLPPVLPYAKARAIGFTGLVYVDADGDGRVVPPAIVAR